MNEVTVWLFQALTVAGAVGGAVIGVKVGIARLEERVKNLQADMDILRVRSHDLANVLQGHEMRHINAERRLDKLEG